MSKAKTTQKRPARAVQIVTGISALLSLVILWAAGSAFSSDMAGFRSCATNNTGLSVHVCGKQSLNPGDIVITLLFILAGCMVVSLLTASWRMVRRSGNE